MVPHNSTFLAAVSNTQIRWRVDFEKWSKGFQETVLNLIKSSVSSERIGLDSLILPTLSHVSTSFSWITTILGGGSRVFLVFIEVFNCLKQLNCFFSELELNLVS